jgi:hypothetical protein
MQDFTSKRFAASAKAFFVHSSNRCRWSAAEVEELSLTPLGNMVPSKSRRKLVAKQAPLPRKGDTYFQLVRYQVQEVKLK